MMQKNQENSFLWEQLQIVTDKYNQAAYVIQKTANTMRVSISPDYGTLMEEMEKKWAAKSLRSSQQKRKYHKLTHRFRNTETTLKKIADITGTSLDDGFTDSLQTKWQTMTTEIEELRSAVNRGSERVEYLERVIQTELTRQRPRRARRTSVRTMTYPLAMPVQSMSSVGSTPPISQTSQQISCSSSASSTFSDDADQQAGVVGSEPTSETSATSPTAPPTAAPNDDSRQAGDEETTPAVTVTTPPAHLRSSPTVAPPTEPNVLPVAAGGANVISPAPAPIPSESDASSTDSGQGDSSSSSSASSGGHGWTLDSAYGTIHRIMGAVPTPQTIHSVKNKSDLAAWSASTSGDIELGRGGNGMVYLLRHARTTEPVALKMFILPHDTMDRDHMLHIISKEAIIQEQLGRHAGFPRSFGWLTLDPHTIGLAMEFIGDRTTGKSTTLWDALRTGSPRMCKHVARQLALDVANGINDMHDLGFLMNDLKANNVLLSEENGCLRAKVIDFGHACEVSNPVPVYRISEADKVRYRTEGLYRHVAPEVALDGNLPTIESDIFQVGHVLKGIGRVFQLHDIHDLGVRCCDVDVSNRPELHEVVTEIAGGASSTT